MRRFLTIFIFLLGLAPTAVLAADVDADGLEDEWELGYFPSLSSQSSAGDPDEDGLTNLDEQAAGTDPTREDTDGDGLSDAEELAHVPPLDPVDMDSDGDFLLDGEELALGTDPTRGDTDGDGLNDFIEDLKGSSPLEADSDGGGIWDGEEVLVDGTDPLDPTDDHLDSDDDGLSNYTESLLGTNPFSADTDGDWLADGQEDANMDGVWDPEAGETAPALADTDGDGLHDGWEVLVYHTDPFVQDSDGDGLTDGEEHAWHYQQYDCLSPSEVDSDRDGLTDGEELLVILSDPCEPDSDGDGLLDISEVFDDTDPSDPSSAAEDQDNDGLSDLYESAVSGSDPALSDTDGDGLTDSQEWLPLEDGFLTDPLDSDTDDDGLLDGSEGGKLVDGQLAVGTSPIQWDTDADGLSDALEKGRTEPEMSPLDPDGTNLVLFAADGDPTTRTNPRDGDSDNDGLYDGTEDKNHNGVFDADETNPLVFDTDGDGIDDGWETQYSTPEVCATALLGPLDPLDPGDGTLDNDADGLTNFQEYTLTRWDNGTYVKNSTNPCKADTDEDGLKDGLEFHAKYGPPGPAGRGSDPNNPDTDGDGLTDGVEDANGNGIWGPLSETNPVQWDTDGDGLADGWEDTDNSGTVGSDETDPKVPDTDGDGLTDGEEVNQMGTDPLDPDTDEDGLPDGLEAGTAGEQCPSTRTSPLRFDTDGDGLSDGQEDLDGDGCFDLAAGETNPLSPDTDGDKLGDGLETGVAGDLDPTTTTDPLLKDTDGDGLWDSHEDKNKDGLVDPTESDPNVVDTDAGGIGDGVEVLEDGTDPTNPLDDATADPDGDGLINSIELELGTDRFDSDSDHDFIPDNVEVGDDPAQPANTDGDAFIDALDPDSDGDGIPDLVEAGDEDLATAPVNSDQDTLPDYQDPDSDEDGISDAVEWAVDATLDGISDPDADGDGTPNYLDDNSDDDDRSDAEEGTGDDDDDGIPNFVDADDTDGPQLDSDGDGLSNQTEIDLGTDPFNPDTDDDGLTDKEDVDSGANPLDRDSDDDGLLDSLESLEDTDADLLNGVVDPDSDDDGVFDGTESGVVETIEGFSYVGSNGTEFTIAGTLVEAGNFVVDEDPGQVTDPQNADSDEDGWDDGAEDPNHNGAVDEGESDPTDVTQPEQWPEDARVFVRDTDGDGLTDLEEQHSLSNPLDADTDEDGLWDGLEHNWRNDTDLDGLANVLDADSDGDGLPDGLEQSVMLEGPFPETRTSSPNYIRDADPATSTGALLWDTDRDGVRDGLEDWNHNGTLDEGESDPLDADSILEDELPDQDGDGLPDGEELAMGSSPDDIDSDDDGVPDGQELNGAVDSDNDGLLGLLDPDSDNDGLADGTERGVVAPDVTGEDGTDVDRGNFQADLDPTTRTRMLVADSDLGGLMDGSEDTDKNGRVDQGEGDPLSPSDDFLYCADSDGDGLCDGEEKGAGSDPRDADSDDDGVADGLEHNWRFDTDGDGQLNVLDPDSDQDSLWDGTEMGVTQPVVGLGNTEGTDLEAETWQADADPLSLTYMLVRDTDGGGVADGIEDLNGDGMAEPGETDPNDPDDDGAVSEDIDGDGLTNDEELAIGTNPYDPDSDGDTIRDDVEVGDDPENPVDTDKDGTIDALDEDSDDDTLPDIDEAGDTALETLPYDTDRDGRPDYQDTDSDDDGLDDEVEVNQFHTDPTLADTDGGGADDYLETQVHQSDPLDPDDDFVGWLEDGARVQGGPGCSSASPVVGGELAAWWLLAAAGLILLVLRRRRMGRWALLGVLLMTSPPALADYHPDAKYTLVTGNPFRLDPDADGVVSLFSDDLPIHLEVRAGASLHYIDSSATVVREGEVLRELLPYRVEMQLSSVVGLWDVLEFGLHVPVALFQESQYAGYGLGSAGFMGLGNISLFGKVRILDSRKSPLGLALVLPILMPTATDTGYMGAAGFGLHPTLVLGSRLDKVSLFLNFGYLLQERHTLFDLVDDDKVTAGLGVQLDVLGEELLSLQGTFHGAVRAGAPFAHAEETLAEVNGALRSRLGAFVLLLGGGKGLSQGFGTPDFRVFAQVTFGHRPDPDRDKDGIRNEVDACPDLAEDQDQFEDEDGCPDVDNDQDEILDELDSCRNEAEDKDRFRDEDGCPDPDNDQDGIPDEKDRCPMDAEDLDEFQDLDGCPDPDNDGDGIPDEKDQCPLEKEVFNDYKDDDGCPDKKLAELQKAERRIQINQKIHFKFMSAEIESDSFEILDQVAQILLDKPEVLLVSVEGHTDRTGSKSFNLELSLARASSVVDYLVSKGVDRRRLKSVGFGYSRRIDYRNGREANYNNRRVEFNVVEMSEPAVAPPDEPGAEGPGLNGPPVE